MLFAPSRIDLAFVVGSLALLGVALASYARFRRAVRRPPDHPPSLARYPSLTVIRPVRGRDVGARENFAAALQNGYPGEVETLFVFDDETDPGLDPARDAIRAHRAGGGRGTASILYCGQPPAGRTGKLHAMATGMRYARGELVAFGDSDTRPDETLLRVLVDELLADPRNGSTFAPVVVLGPARTLGDVGYQLLINGLYGPAVAAVAARGHVPFIMGQLMVFRRAALRDVGGVECADGQLVDDMHIGMALHAAGWRNVMVTHPLPIVTGDMRFADFVRLVRRWMLFSHTGLPRSFARPLWVMGAAFWLGLAAAFGALAAGHPFAALLPAATVLALSVELDALQHRFGGARFGARLGWFSCALFLLVPPIFAMTRLNRQMEWRGRRYPVSDEHRLAPAHS